MYCTKVNNDSTEDEKLTLNYFVGNVKGVNLDPTVLLRAVVVAHKSVDIALFYQHYHLLLLYSEGLRSCCCCCCCCFDGGGGGGSGSDYFYAHC